MKDSEVRIGGLYVAKVSDKLTTVRIDSKHSRKGWNATNTATGKKIHIKSGQRLRAAAADKPAGTTKAATPKKGKDRSAKPDEAPRQFDPDKCATPRCRGEVALTHLGKPLCQKCWEKHCREVIDDVAAELPATDEGAAAPVEAAATNGGAEVAGEAAVAAASDTEQTGYAPRSELTLEEAAKLDAKRAKKTRAVPAGRQATKSAGEPKTKRVSALDAAAAVLKAAGKPMHTQDMIAAMAEQGLWTSPGGRTPHATLYSAILREIGIKGEVSRFTKVDRGLFEFHAAAIAAAV